MAKKIKGNPELNARRAAFKKKFPFSSEPKDQKKFYEELVTRLVGYEIILEKMNQAIRLKSRP